MIYTRLTYNSQEWISPSGIEGKSRSATTFESCGFGMEEWLFNSKFIKDGYHYGYIQGVKHSKEGDENEPLHLFTIQHPHFGRYIVAKIDKWEKLKQEETVSAMHNFRGQIAETRTQISDLVNINTIIALQKFDDHLVNKKFFNIKFKTFKFLNDQRLSRDPIIQGFNRFLMYRR